MNLKRISGVTLSAMLLFSGFPAGAEAASDGSSPAAFDISSLNFLPAPQNVEVVFEPQDDVRVFHLDLVTRNVQRDEVIGVFIKTTDGKYWPVPKEQLDPPVIPTNQRAAASVKVVGMPRGEPFAICLYALKRRGQEIIREWFDGESREPLPAIRYAIELGTINVR